jgi:hypothetical protein
MDDGCISCGRETRAGTALFGARKRGRDMVTGREGFICRACQPGEAMAGPDHAIPLSARYVVIDFPGGLPGY